MLPLFFYSRWHLAEYGEEVTSALSTSGRGGAFGYVRIQFGRNRQSDGREGEHVRSQRADGEAVIRLHREQKATK